MRGSTSASYQQLRLRMSSSSLNASLLPLHPERGVLGIWQACELARPNSIVAVAASMIVLIREPLLSGQAVQVEVPVSLVDLDLGDVRVWALLQTHFGPIEVKLSVGDVAGHEVDVDEHSFFGSAVDQGAISDGWNFRVGLDLVLQRCFW